MGFASWSRWCFLSSLEWLPQRVEEGTAKPQYPLFWAILHALCPYHHSKTKSISKSLCRYQSAEFLGNHLVLSMFTEEWHSLFFQPLFYFFPCVCTYAGFASQTSTLWIRGASSKSSSRLAGRCATYIILCRNHTLPTVFQSHRKMNGIAQTFP